MRTFCQVFVQVMKLDALLYCTNTSISFKSEKSFVKNKLYLQPKISVKGVML